MKPGQFLKRFVKRKQGTPFQLALPLTRTVVATLSIILALLVGWSFFMGWMVGRGQNPEANLAKLTGTSRSVEAPAWQTPESPTPPKEELSFAESVQNDSANFQKPGGEGLSAWPAPQNPVAEKPAPKPRSALSSSPGRQGAPGSGKKFDFVYQVAAFRTAQEAERLRDRLNKAGIRSSTRKTGRVVIVLTNLRGTDADARALGGKLRDMKLGSPLQLSRKPVSPGAKK